MARRRYPTDLPDPQWSILEPLILPSKPGGCPRSIDMREVVNTIFYVLRGGIPWRMLPHDLPPWQTVYHYFRLWRIDGRWEELNRILRQRLRVRMDREATPSAGIMDSQSTRTTEKWDPEAMTAA